MVILLALGSAIVIGFGDYWGGRAAAHRPALVVAFYVQTTAALAAAVLVPLLGWNSLHPGDLLLGAMAGAFYASASVALFHGLANGRMSIVAPITAAVGVLLPVLLDIVVGVSLRPITWTAMALVIVAVPMVALRPGGDHRLSLRAELGLSLAAGAGYATFFVMFGHTSSDSGQWPIGMSCLSGALVVGAIAAAQRIPFGRPPRMAIAAGLCSIVAGAGIARALQIGPISLATVLGSLYPVVTAGLAVRFDGERLRPINAVGIVLAVGAAGVVAASH